MDPWNDPWNHGMTEPWIHGIRLTQEPPQVTHAENSQNTTGKVSVGFSRGNSGGSPGSGAHSAALGAGSRACLPPW